MQLKTVNISYFIRSLFMISDNDYQKEISFFLIRKFYVRCMLPFKDDNRYSQVKFLYIHDLSIIYWK